MPDNVDKLFEIMQAKGAASDRGKFRKVFLTPGNKGYKIRKDIYDGLRADGIIDSPTYEDFRRKLRLGGTPTVNKYRQQMFNSVDPNKSRASELTHRAIGQAVRATNNVRKPVVAKVVNRKGKLTGEKFAITPAKTVEDLDREYAQETTKNWENELHDQMADADKDAAKISDMFKSFIGSTDEVGSVWGNMTRGGGMAGTPHSVTTNNGILENTEARQILAAGDYNRKRRELLQLEQDSRNGAIFDNHSFFRGMYDAAKDTGFLTGGASDLINSGSLLATKQDLDKGIHTEAGDMLLQQAVKNSDAQSQYGDNQGWMYTGGIITTNMAPFMVQIGSAGFSKGMSNTIGKVVQGAASKVALGTMEKATGMVGAHIANYIGKVTGLTTKAFGKAIQYGIVGAAQANTVGLGNVANDVINRYTGQVYQDEQGNYKFGTFDSDGKLVHEGGEDFLTSLVKGEAAQTIEFATELAGGGIDAAGTALKNFVTKGGKKIINKYNMENVSKVIDFLLNNKVSKHARYLKAGADRTLGNVELNSIVGESLEEELGIIANTVFTGDNKISDLWDEKQQSQIWGGMLLSIGLMKGAVAPFHAYNAKQYYSYKHKLNKADVNLSQLLGKEKWDELRNKIDATTNKDMPELINKINRDVALGKNRQPVREYIQNLLIMRGYDIGNMLAAKKAVEDKGKGVSVKNMEKNQAYQQGRDAYGYDTHEIQLDQADKQKTLAQLLGITEQQLSTMSDEELDNLSGRDDNLDKAIYDYQLSTIRYQGVADNAQDQVDLAAQKAAQAVDMYTDKSRNTIRNATIKAAGGLEDYGVYVINGNIATHDDGSIDVGNSDDMILFYDPTTNTVEHADATRFAELGSEENADEVRNQAVADAKENAIKEITGIIDGVVEVGTQFKTIDADGTEHTYEVLADNGDGTAMITIDGNIPTQLVKGENVNVPVSFEELQKMKDASDQQRLQAAKAQREQMEKERAEQQMQAQTTQAENPAQENNTQSAPIEDNLDYSDIIREDGKVQMVDVFDKDGNNLFPDAKDVFYIQGNKMRTKFAYIDANGELKKQSFPTGLVKIKTRGEVSVDDYKKYRSMILSAESSAVPESSMIEDNSGAIEADRGGIEVNDELPPVPDNVTINGDGTYSVDGSVQGGENTTAPAEQTEQTPAMTLEDGTIVPMLEDGNPDFSKLTADQTAELYDSQFGEDADSVISGWVSDAKKALDKANNMTVKGKNFVEQKAAKEAKEKAIADAQAAYDSAIAIRDAYNSRQLAKVEDDADGRKNLIEKARRKYNRLKSAVKDDAEAVSQLYKDVVGSLLHRLYDGTGIDVTDTIPLTAEEYVASNLGAHSLNYEGTETSKGVKQETGLSREDFAKTQLLAADGKGTTIDDLVHSLWENRPSNLESLNTQDIRNALIDVLTSGFKASEARNYIENLRIAQAENILEEQNKADDNAAFAEENKAESEQQTETAPESEEKTGEDNSDEINDEENEQTNAPEQNKFPDKLREGSKAIEVPDDATEENPLGLQLSEDKVPFEIEGGKSGETYNINDNEDRQRLINDNKVDDKDILDIDMPKHVHKAIKELCKKMGLKVQFLYMGARSNGWIENGTMYLALDTEKATQFVFGHEMTHAIKQKNPEAYKELVKVAMAVTTRKKFEEDLAKVYQNYYGISGYNNVDDYVEEVVADNLGKFINDFDLAQKFSLRLNHPVLATILHAIQKIKSLLYGDFYKSVDALERIVEKAYVKTAKGEVTNSETGEDVSFSLRQKPEPKKKGVGYKVFVLKDGKLYPPMVANPDGAATPVGVWLDADAAPIAGESKTGRPQVKQGGKGTQGGSGKLAYRPGWHLGVVPYAIQFNLKDAEGNKTLFPKNFVFAEVEYAADVDYQEEARQEGINPSGKYQHSLAGLKHLPTDGYYMYRTNPNPETDPWVITGAMKVNRILTRAEQAELVKNAGREPQQIQEGDIVTDDVVNSINQEIADAPKFSLKVYHGSGADFTEFDFDHMGEGAGSQVFGWGGYVTSSKKIGKSYATLMDNDPSRAYYRIQRSNGTRFAKKYPTLDSFLHGDKQIAMNDKFTEQEKIDYYNEMKKLAEPYHNLYEVDIPEDNGSNYLNWDAPITDELIDKVAKSLPSLRSYDIKDLKKDRTFDNFYKTISMRSAKDDATFNDDKAASQLLASLGYTGIKYKAGRNFGGAEEGDTNYVIFKPEDMRITEHTKFSLKKVNDAFNQRLDELVKNPNQKDKILRLGRSSSFLKAGGIADAEIELDFDKLMRKSKQGYVHEHPFDATDVKDLPMAIANPISVFDNTNGRNDGQVILTELKKEDRNFIVAIQTENQNRKGGVVLKVNKIVTLFPKDARGVINWFNQGKATNIDKEKALHFIEALQNHSGTTITDEELKSAANIINSFETTKKNGEKVDVDGTKFSLKDEEYLKAVEDGNMEKAQKMVNEAADAAGYSTDSSYQGTSAFNGAAPWGNGYFLTKDERKEAWDNGEFEGESTLGDYINDDIDGGNLEELTNAASYRAADPMRKEAIDNVRNAIQKKAKTITMYRSVPSDVKEGSFRNGDWVTPSRAYAVDNAKLHGWGDDYNIIEQKVPVDDVWFDGNDIAEWGYGREEDYINDTDFAYKNSKNNKKLLDAVTYDDNGNVIPLSQRFNEKNKDVRFSLKDEKTMFGMHNISVDKLRKAIKQGGFAAPSMGVVDSKNGIYSDYGEITLIPKAEKLAKRTGKNAGTFTADAWTPTYPQVERIMNKQGEKAFNTDMNVKLGDVDNGIYSNVRESWKGYLSSGDVRDGLYWHYLFDKGMNPETIYQTGKYDNDITNEVMRISDNGNKTDYTDKEVAELIQLMNKATGKDNDVDAQREKLKARIASAEKQGNHLLVALKKKRLEELEGVENFYIAADFVNDVVRNNRKNGKVDVHDTMGAAKKKVEDNKKLSDDFPSWLDKKTEEYGVEEMLYNGTTPSGKPKYIPNTIDNAVKLMKKQGVAGGYTAFGSELGVFIAKNSPEVNTLAAMKNAKDKLIPFGDERHNQIKDKITKEFLELSDEIRVGSNNRYAFDDSGVSRMVELTDHKGNEKEYLKKAYNIEVSDEWMDRYNKLLDTIKKDYKVFYFETKFMRPYGLDEFEKAIVPSDTPSDVVDALKKAGIDVSSYERGNAEDRQKVTMDAINSSDNIRFSLAGERGAAAADKAEERTARMDNLSVARKMEEEKKDANAIKMATGWERGADGKWRYEMPDAKINDTMDVGGGHIVKRYEDDMLWNGGKLSKVIDAPELFKAYPQLKDVRIETDAIMNDMPSNGEYNAKTNTITIHADELKYMNSILNHEIQHAIQSIEGFDRGGSPRLVRGEIKNRLAEVTKQIRQLRAEGKEDEAKAIVEKNRGLYNAYQANDDYNSYKSLAGEVEARNVQERMNMTPEERRKSLAESTEDVARKDQILLGVGDVSFSLRDMADGKESGAADMAEDLKSLNTPDEVDDAIKTAIDDMPSGWKMANKKMIHVAQALGENRKAEIAGEEPKFSLKDGTLIKAGTYFSGGGLVEEGLKGIIDPVVAVEYDEKISGVYRNNFGQHIVTADVRDVDPKELVKQIDGEVEYFHASPVCKNYSQAKSNHAEVELDKETAASTAEFINAVKPKVVTIENVKGYKDSDAMKIITDALDANGYTWDADVYNAADYGGYTNRERLIVRAVRDGKLPEKPKKLARKSGWYEAVADIIPTLTEKKNGVAPWMDIRLKADGIDWRNIDKPLYVMGSAYADGKVPHAFADELLPTLRTKSGDVIVMPDGKVYRAMGRVLARVSGVSDDYKMPFSENLSHTIIGNGIPTQLTEHVIAPLLTGSDPKFSIRTYHGTGASFDKFDLSHALEGEGSETFGHGVYVTNSSKIGREYAQRAKQRKMADLYKNMRYPDGVKGDIFKRRVFGEMVNDVATGGSVASAKEFAKKRIGADANDIQRTLENLKDREKGTEYEQNLKDRLAEYKEGLKWIDSLDEDYLTQGNANRYDVDIPDDNGSNYLDWENPMSEEQINAIRDALAKKGVDVSSWEKRGFKLDLPFKKVYSMVLPMMMRYKPEDVSQFLSSLGFTGIKYPAGMIYGGAEEDDYNYVIFDEDNANIVGNTRFSLRGSTPYDKQMEEWKEKNHLDKDAAPMEKPIKQDNENIFDYMNRMVEWTRNQNLWKTAPKQTGFQDALAKWKADNGLSPDAYPPVRPHRENYSTEIGYTEDLEEYNKKKELWKSAPKPKDFDLSVDLEDMNKQLRNIRKAVLNQKNYDQRTVKAVSDLVRKMLNIGWGDGLSRGKVGNLLSAAKNATGANDVKKYLDKAMGILAENYLNRLSTAYDNLINTKGARADQSGVIKMGSLDAKGQAFMSEYKKAINMDDKSLNTYIANIEENSAKNEDNVEMNDYRLAGIQAAIMYKQQIGGNDADISELQRQIGELKNKKDATKEDKDLLKSLEKKLFENKFDRITMYENLLNNIQRMVKESKGRAKEFREEITEHKNEILHRANLDLEGVDSTYYDTTTAKKKLVNNDLQRAVFSSTYTFEQFLKFFGKKAANGEGYLYNYFTKLNQDALDEEQLYNEMNRNALDEKTKELFGKEKFMKLVGIDGKGMKEMDVEVTDYSNKETGKRTIHLKQGQMLYIYLVNKETDGEMKLRAMGITEEDVAAIEENLDPRVKAMGEWLQDEYLPECQRRYQATHTKYFGAPMKEVENYFPLAINNRARNVKEDVNQDSDAMSQLAGTSTGAIVTRRVNVIPLDIENADAFEVAFNHLQEMEEWSAMLPFRQDVNTLLSYTHFRNQVQNMSSVAYGSGKTLWDEFKQTAQIAAGTYKPKVNAGMMDSRIAAAMGGIAVAKISGRLWTAIKQSQSATVFLPECDFTRFVKNGVNPYGSWKWAMENIPDFRKRVENMTYGDVKLRQYLDELEKWHDWTKTISKIGMAPNILVDGITCAVGARSVYETEVNRLTKLGYPKEKAEEKAYYKAVAAYNKTQQSSGGMYLSPMQVDRTYASAALSLFKNANYAYGRMQIEACRGLARTYDFWGGKHKTTLIESMTRQIMEEDGLDENTARAIAKATYNRTFRQSIGRLINFATLVPVSWALYKVLPYLLFGDDDDKKTDMIEEAVLKGFATSLSDNYVIPFASNILNAGLKVEDGKPTFDPEVFKWQNLYINPATSDLANIYSMIGNQKWYSVANKLGMLGVQSLIGFNPETVGALYQAFAEADYDNGNVAKEWQIGILKAISAPEESIRELYMDELGLKSGDIKKIPLAELEKRYAERQINRDNLLSQIGMDAETFNGYVEKYQKSFEKKIKDKMDKWDEYDKKKADEFFDTTSDPKLKDMIAKKRANDANAAADEQIAKEGLNQEKKGKEPSEEAYDAVKMSIDVAEDNAISTYNKVLNKRYAALNDEYNNQTDAMKYIFMSKHPNFKAYKDLKSEYTTYGKKMKELKEKLVSADGYDAKQTILKQIRAERDKFYELQSKVR
jgi:site-specific DNA-cytosine methylase